ncbi:hypothetical protein [Horticoccus sp. 23ND18S-11]|uniref:hypothetical protein n=1 Tax=Horticoccus sp. 23ND18S-11 TaxID=3391832 RepID=UPI0039C9E165
MPDIFQSSALQQLYNGTNANPLASAQLLTAFRTGGDDLLDQGIAALDKRIASFENALIGPTGSTATSAEYPYDRAGLRREFLDELVTLLIQNTYAATGITGLANSALSDPNTAYRQGINPTVILKSATTGSGIFDNLATNVAADVDPRLNMLTDDGKALFKSYANLIESVFAEGDKMGDDPARAAQLVSAIQPMTIDGISYDRVAQVSGYDPVAELPTYNTYLLQAGTQVGRVFKDSSGSIVVSGPATATDQRLLLGPIEAPLNAAGTAYSTFVDGLFFEVFVNGSGLSFRTDSTQVPTPATVMPALLLNVTARGTEFPDVRILSSFRATAANGASYLFGLSTEGKVYITSLAPARREVVGPTASLSSLEYLLFYNEARIRVLRGQLVYKEAIVREIQDDLKKANDALADLEFQSGVFQAQNPDGSQTYQFSSETRLMNLFNATNSRAGTPIFGIGGNDSYHSAVDWQQNRTALKNYIDRRSAEAQQATLDYQNVLNRFNNAYEVMAKLQEKLDTLLKAQLRNL